MKGPADRYGEGCAVVNARDECGDGEGGERRRGERGMC